ncbi:GGDEF domain-containing protein [Marinobacter sp. R17]|uniref:GGDEF domain-containing protein n=1 Tax=Marinobacter sp. R17 TaxID=2484250 RepID=UPI000F4C302C|nr:GGDEF domain-containing protein [Marinobacter sp. R17]ROU00880.1 GGDEF domain-containing protein [Marinobacter sp. R17]
MDRSRNLQERSVAKRLALKYTATNPTETILGFQRQIVYHVHFWTLVAVAPLVLVQWSEHHPLLSLLLAIFCLNLVAVILYLRLRGRYLFKGRFFALFAIACTVYSTIINGHNGLFWGYPAIAAMFFLLSLREALILNGLFIIILAGVSFERFPTPEFWRITSSLSLTAVFVAVFAWLVGRMQSELTDLATTDPLTGCLNRSQMADELNSQIQLRERYERVASLILVDLDHFKTINDRWGHATGDTVLQEAATRLRRRLRDTDMLFRIGGEEFMMVLPETRQKAAEELARQLLDTLSVAPFSKDIQVTASAGVTELIKGETWSTWLNRADQALYTAKEAGRNRVMILRGSEREASGDDMPVPNV